MSSKHQQPKLTLEAITEMQRLERASAPAPWEYIDTGSNEMLVQDMGRGKIKHLLSLSSFVSKKDEIKLCAALRNNAKVLLEIARRHLKDKRTTNER